MAKRQPCPKSASGQSRTAGPRRDRAAPKEFSLPAFSLPLAPKAAETQFDKLRKKTIRRNAPPGEDIKEIRNIIKTLKGQTATVQEFIRLIGPSTGDNGDTLKVVMNDDLASFRKLAKKVYEMVTQDNSDVLLNQQTELSEYYREKKEILNFKMTNAIEEIHNMAPDFDFERYYRDKDKYIQELFPLPEDLKVVPEEIEMMNRQAAYHRLQWLRSEGERLNEENNSLKKRLKDMKQMYTEEQRRTLAIGRQADEDRQALEAAEADKQNTLEKLSESLEKTIIAKEMSIRMDKDRTVLEPMGPVERKASKKKMKVGPRRPRPTWSETTASEINAKHAQEAGQSEMKKASTSPFHFSPLRTPSPRPAEPPVTSPFHYSPPRTPPAPGPSGRRGNAPPDTWGGFG